MQELTQEQIEQLRAESNPEQAEETPRQRMRVGVYLKREKIIVQVAELLSVEEARDLAQTIRQAANMVEQNGKPHANQKKKHHR